MDAWKFVKKEPRDNEYYETEADYYNTLDSYSSFESKQLHEIKIENTEEFYSTFDSGELYNVKIESEDEFYPKLDSGQLYEAEIQSKRKFIQEEENNNQDAWKYALSYYPKLSIPLVRLEYSQNQEVIKYLKPLLPAITSSTKLQSAEKTTELNLILKTEAVELETLDENTLVRSPRKDCYASPWDFVSVANTFDQNSSTTNTIKQELGDKNLSEKVIKPKDDGGTFSKFFVHNSNSLPKDNSNVQKAKVFEKKFTQQTLNFGEKHKKDEHDKINKKTVRFSNYDIPAHIEKPQPRSSEPDCPSDKSLFCKLCDKQFKRKSYLTQHKRNKHSDESMKNVKPPVLKTYICEICGRPFTQKSALRKHYLTHDAIKRYECDTCDKKFKTKEYLRQHIQAHDVKKFTCMYCLRLYRRKSTLRRHMKLHDTGYGTIRKYTPKIQSSQSKLKDDKNDDKAKADALKLYECDVCGQRFEDKSSMRVHIEFLHIEIFGEHASTTPQPQTSKPSSSKPFQCRICHRRYTQSSHLKRHEESHSKSRSHVCELCGQNFSVTSSLTRHLRVKHNMIRPRGKKGTEKLKKIAESEKNYAEKVTKVPDNAEKVKKTSKDFACKICSRVLTSLGDLRRHCATHDARKPYECDICKKQFAVKGYLYAHILTHDNWKPYPCEICSKVYRRKSSLQRHIRISHTQKKKKKD